VSAGCKSARAKGGTFPPSAGEVYAACERESIAAHRRAVSKPISKPFVYKLPPPRRKFSLAEMADWSVLINHASPPYCLRVDEAGQALTIPAGYPGAGKPVEYGYMTPKEAQWAKGDRSRASNARSAAKPFAEVA